MPPGATPFNAAIPAAIGAGAAVTDGAANVRDTTTVPPLSAGGGLTTNGLYIPPPTPPPPPPPPPGFIPLAPLCARRRFWVQTGQVQLDVWPT